MDIQFRTRKLQRIFNSERELAKAYGPDCAKKIRMRMAVLSSAPSLSTVPTDKPDRCHELKGKRTGEYAVDLVHPYRLTFKPVGSPNIESVQKEQVYAIQIIDVEDYH